MGDLAKNSLLSAKKFPVPLRKEFSSKPLNFLTNWALKSAAEASFSQIPCSFPC
jgi:hypothetical protein